MHVANKSGIYRRKKHNWTEIVNRMYAGRALIVNTINPLVCETDDEANITKSIISI